MTETQDNRSAMRKTIVARIATFDTSIPNPTPEQVAETVRLLDSALEVFKGTPDGNVLQKMRDELGRSRTVTKETTAAEPAVNVPVRETDTPPLTGAERGATDPRLAQSADGGGDTGAVKRVSWSSTAMDYLTKVEKFRSTAYPDPEGQTSRWSVGYGNQFHPGQKKPVKKGDTVDPAKATLYMADAMAYNVDRLRSSIGEHRWGALTGGQKLALTSWAYNVGERNVRGSTLAKRMQRGDSAVDVIRQELPKWNSKGTATDRRMEEIGFAASDLYE